MGKRIIYKSKSSLITILFGCVVIIALAFIYRVEEPEIFWVIVAYVGSCGVFILIQLFNPKNVFVKSSLEEAGQTIEAKTEDRLSELGVFSYYESSFVISLEKENLSFNWADIETLFAFKIDRLTFDEIALDVFEFNGKAFRITESTPGWNQFLKKLNENFSSIDKHWNLFVSTPAFATNLTLLYDAKGRTKEQAEAKYYK